ncbi:MAG: glycine zipper 2TM domain-containing protein [Burkholderiaceae bacterium]|nr:glycine zipper 2TM domain-containing protein [Burkholderiaceae bacterium]
MKPFSKRPLLAVALIPLALLGACSTTKSNDTALDLPSTSGVDTNAYGRVESIQVEKVAGADRFGMGSVVGGLIGGLVANQFGGGNGKLIATAAGAGGGVYAGHELEVKNRQQEVYKIRVQLDNGDYRTVSQDNDTDLSVGNRVHIDNGHVYRY